VTVNFLSIASRLFAGKQRLKERLRVFLVFRPDA